jgi:hypothetical protein
MYYPDANDPYGQQALPYQPYEGQTNPTMPEGNVVGLTSPIPRAATPTIMHARSAQASPVKPRKSKAETLSFVHECKKWLVAGSIVAFGLLGGLVAGHAVGTTSNQATPATSPSINGGGGGFFDQQPGQQGQQQGQQGGGGGNGFGNNNPSQPPVSGSHTS